MKKVTVENIESCSEQEVFDFVGTHLLKQNKKSRNDFNCLYLSPEGLSCAVGCLIPGELYNQKIENKTLKFLSSYYGFDKHLELLKALQEMHDFEHVEDWVSNLKEIAKKFKLNDDVIKNFKQ